MKKRCRKLLAYFDKRISLQEFDNQIPKLIDNFPKDMQGIWSDDCDAEYQVFIISNNTSMWIDETYVGFNLSKTGNNYCPVNKGNKWSKLFNKNNTAFRNAQQISASADDTDILYVASRAYNTVEKVEMDSTTKVTRIVTAGRRVKDNNDGDAGSVAASSVNFWKPRSLFVNSSKIYVSDEKYTVQEFNENNFTAAAKDTSWQTEYGGMPITRYEGAKDAIKAVVTDSALYTCLLYTSPSPRDGLLSRMPSSA